MNRRPVRPWGPIAAAISALVFAAPTLVLPADSTVGAKLLFIVVGSVLLVAAIAWTRLEPPPRASQGTVPTDDVTP
jgi:peptidoglycan/LPS O-acetylase OafA/YrhL